MLNMTKKCGRCNTVLGLVNKNVKTLEDMIKFLKEQNWCELD